MRLISYFEGDDQADLPIAGGTELESLLAAFRPGGPVVRRGGKGVPGTGVETAGGKDGLWVPLTGVETRAVGGIGVADDRGPGGGNGGAGDDTLGRPLDTFGSGDGREIPAGVMPAKIKLDEILQPLFSKKILLTCVTLDSVWR